MYCRCVAGSILTGGCAIGDAILVAICLEINRHTRDCRIDYVNETWLNL